MFNLVFQSYRPFFEKTLSLRDCPHDKEQGISASKLMEALLLSVTGIQQISWLPNQRYSRLELMSLKQLDHHRANNCWYAETQEFRQSTGCEYKCTNPFQHSLNFPCLNITNVEKNRIIQIDVIKLDAGFADYDQKMILPSCMILLNFTK